MSENNPKTNVSDFIGELEAGSFIEKLAHMLSEVALGTVIHGNGSRKGKVSLDLSFAVVGNNNQVIISSKLSNVTLTKRGKRSEETVTDTPMFVGKGGVLTIDMPKEEFNGQFSLAKV
jgi:hypothetical protein